LEMTIIIFMIIGSFVYLCDFHREQAWQRWVNATKHNVRQAKETVICMLRRIARSSTIEKYNTAIVALKDSEIWKDSSELRKWFSTQWEPQHKVLIILNSIATLVHYATLSPMSNRFHG